MQLISPKLFRHKGLRLSVTFLFLFSTPFICCAQMKQVFPQKITETITIDGQLNESAWGKADIADGFIQTSPNAGASASQTTNVQLLYDNEAVYVGAMLYDTNPDSILTELSARDNTNVNADRFGVTFDTFDDDQNAFTFLVTASGVQADSKFSNRDNEDGNFNAVWDSKVKIVDNGWIVEMKIPYYSLRFPNKDIQNWGVNFYRNIRRIREESYWQYMDPNKNGFVNLYGEAVGFESIEPPMRLSFNPFISTNFNTSTGEEISAQPNAGMDVKYGINESFTLDMTLIPDFGGVKSDEQILNLSPFEQQFSENRPFFNEGIELFTNGNLFYSRRIGQINPSYGTFQLNNGERIKDLPQRAKLLNATKVSGRTKGNLGIGLFNAMTDEVTATAFNTNTEEGREIVVQPFTNYSIVALEQALKNSSSLYFTNTTTIRAKDGRDANVTAAGIELLDKDNKYSLDIDGAVSQIFQNGESTIGSYAEIEGTETDGRFNYGFVAGFEDDKYDRNDLGLLFTNNSAWQAVYAGYNINQPSEWYNSFRVNATIAREQLFQPGTELGYSVNGSSVLIDKSFNAWIFSFFSSPGGSKDFFEPRVFDFETYFQRPKRTFAEFLISSDYRKQFAIDASIERGFGKDYYDIDVWNYRIEPRFRVNDHLLLIGSYRNSHQNSDVGFVDHVDENIILGLRDRVTKSTSFIADYKLNENINLYLENRYVWDQVDYKHFYTLDRENGEFKNEYLGNGFNRDNVNFSGFNTDAIFRWRFAPGSDLNIVYKKQLSKRENVLSPSYFEDVSGLFESDHFDGLNIKLVYFLDYHTLKSKLRKTN